MTELEIMQHAKGYLDKLAKGIDPLTDQEVPEDDVIKMSASPAAYSMCRMCCGR